MAHVAAEEATAVGLNGGSGPIKLFELFQGKEPAIFKKGSKNMLSSDNKKLSTDFVIS
jgi:hypothetical protein